MTSRGGVIVPVLIGVVVILVALGLFLFSIRDGDHPAWMENVVRDVFNYDTHPEVWSGRSPRGDSYEFKVNCVGDFEELETCFLWDLDRVKVTAPDGSIHELEKDFNINDYSGEVTRRWVLYGDEGLGLPQKGVHRFDYYRDGEVVRTQELDYTPSSISYPTNITWQRDGDDLIVNWLPPDGVDSSMWYKVLVWNHDDTPELFISDIFDYDASSARLADVPLIDGGQYRIHVAIFYPDGYAYGEDVFLEW